MYLASSPCLTSIHVSVCSHLRQQTHSFTTHSEVTPQSERKQASLAGGKDQRFLSWAGHPTAYLPFRLCQRLHCQHHSQEGCIIQMLNTNYPAKDQVKLNNGKGVMLNIEQIRDGSLSLMFPGAPVVALPHLVLLVHQTACAVTAMHGWEVKNCLDVPFGSLGVCFTTSVLTR